MKTLIFPYYSIVTFGSSTYGNRRSYYRSLASARRDAQSLGGGSLQGIRIVGCDTRKEAISASIEDNSLTVVETVS